MAGVTLEKLFGRKGEIARILTEIGANSSGPFTVEDTNGKVVFRVGAAHASHRYAIQLDDQIIGWVSGDAHGAVIAAVLNYAARQENEKKSLVNELADRYREISLLYHLSERLAASPQPEAVSEIALNEVQRFIPANSGAVLLLDNAALRTVASFGDLDPIIQQGCVLEQIIRVGKAELANDIPVENCIENEQGYRISIVGAPLKTERRTLGIIFLAGRHDRIFTAGELKLLNTIAMQVAPALEISRLYQESIEKARYEHELKMARQVQESLLPQHLPDIPGWRVASRWRPAREVSGDFYDVITGDSGVVDLVIADVTDKGMPASLFMAFTRSILRVSIHSGEEPAKIITEVNQSICRDSYEGLFTTLMYARVDTQTGLLTYVNAGHNPPLLYHAKDGVIETLGRTGLTLGVDQDSTYTQKTARMDAGDFLLFYTDGITEATNLAQEEFGIERLKQFVECYQACEAEIILDRLETATLDFTGQSQQMDDITIMGLKRIAVTEG